ncbi:hypothetical protein UA08_08977 [Talaromyces atroroseus]|uniref:Uncharacterized protein n=1 Tax=Talaromyces atroroseus TaxID=1441469 RepID=A0A1Q5Q7L4_TALAT|nr:hypothetical protein UA08_08977 [Talaromyces atroroseus]OKL55740.1 hypothetical protein UA08_08977 [Talaromyces atroroseus]
MSASLRQTALNSAGLLRRALPNQNAISTISSTRTHSLQLQLQLQLQQCRCRNLQTTSKLWTESHGIDANDRLGKRDTLNPSRAEGTQTGTDDEVASHGASFDPSNTKPESEVEAAGRESAERNKTSNPLDVSPGNREVNSTRDSSKDPPESGVEKPQSARGWTRKSKPVNQTKY